MPSTTIHFPEKILSELDTAARKHGVSRNKYFLIACEAALEKEAGEWPEDFFNLDLSKEDLQLLRESSREVESSILANRFNRGAPVL
ncbi:MAG: hypothetical protein KAH95_08005 [Spirochaetales bacterium]|nr:hypothetical protein [Spirochaetales bacterium]